MNTKQNVNSSSIVSLLKNEKGIILIAVLILIAILAIIGSIAAITTTTDLKISSNYKTGVTAFYAAEAGINEARHRLRGSPSAGDPDTNNGSWSAYILTYGTWTTSSDPDFNANYFNYIPTATQTTNTNIVANSLQSDISYWVNIRHKKESDLFLPGEAYTDYGSGQDDIIYYGYATSTSTTLEQFTTNSPDLSRCAPIEIIRSYGISGSSLKGTTVQVRKNPGPPIVAAVYGNTVQGNGDVTVNGNDNCSPPALPLPAVAYYSPENLIGGGSVNLEPDDSQTTQLASPLNLNTYVDNYKSIKTVTLSSDQTNYTIGSSSNYEIVYCDATQFWPDNELDLTTQSPGGYGILVVNGDVNFSGNITWHGIIIATGNITFTGGGTKTIYGAVLASDVAQITGTVDIDYDSCEVENANAGNRYLIFRWKDKTFD